MVHARVHRTARICAGMQGHGDLAQRVQNFPKSSSTTNASSLTHVCTAAGTGYTVSESLATSGSRSLAAQAGWVNYPSSCTWTASGPGGSATFTETLTTIAGASGSVTYIHTDGLGSPVARTDASGYVISRTRYEPYGYVAAGVQPTIGFTGHVNDGDTGLTYMQQRYYDPVAGRFLSIDPVTTDANTGGSFNRYVYASNGPYKYVDPDGRQERAAEAFGDQYRNDFASGNVRVYDPFVVPSAVVIGAMLIGPPIAAAVLAGAPVEATVAAGGAAAKGAQVAETVAVRTTQAGDKAVRITRADGSVKDISPARVKEYVPNTHPKAPPGTLDKVKFENPLPGSKGFKREPTAEELKVLKEAK
jgi:RHS repeat-associated protein